MRIISIKLLETTPEFYLLEITFEELSLFVKSLVTKKCFLKKNGAVTYYLDTGSSIPVSLWEPVRVFIDTKGKFMSFTE